MSPRRRSSLADASNTFGDFVPEPSMPTELEELGIAGDVTSGNLSDFLEGDEEGGPVPSSDVAEGDGKDAGVVAVTVGDGAPPSQAPVPPTPPAAAGPTTPPSRIEPNQRQTTSHRPRPVMLQERAAGKCLRSLCLLCVLALLAAKGSRLAREFS